MPAAAWIAESELLARAYALALDAHGEQLRATDRRPFIDHVDEVAALLHDAGYDPRLVAAGLLHDAVERGTLGKADLRSQMGDEISTLVLALTEDATIESFGDRKEQLREQVRAAGGRAVTIFAADKLSDIRGLTRGVDQVADSLESRLGTTVDAMAGHYEESVAMIEASVPDSPFIADLHAELERLWATEDRTATPAPRRLAAPSPDPV